MEKKIRLNRTVDIQRVRQDGKSYTHPLFVLIVLRDPELEQAMIGVIATKSVGGAVERNHAKRLLRAAADSLADSIQQDNMVLLIARKRILDSDAIEVQRVLEKQLRKSQIYIDKPPASENG